MSLDALQQVGEGRTLVRDGTSARMLAWPDICMPCACYMDLGPNFRGRERDWLWRLVC
jgi:hypothetical protein